MSNQKVLEEDIEGDADHKKILGVIIEGFEDEMNHEQLDVLDEEVEEEDVLSNPFIDSDLDDLDSNSDEELEYL